jgi:hypothetical protein
MSAEERTGQDAGLGATEGAACGDINDPVRRALCKVCSAPVVGELPFCKDHEPEVP